MLDKDSVEISAQKLTKESLFKKEEKRPFGERIIGSKDPRKMTKEEFNKSPEILYHGTADEKFTYSPSFDYDSHQYLQSSDGSQTLGVGLYTTDDLEIAEQYSLLRQGIIEGKPKVMHILPYQARMYDFRTIDGRENAFVPIYFINEWHLYFKNYYKNLNLKELPWYVREMLTEYLSYINRLISTDEQLDLRVMLATSPHPRLKSPNWPSPPHMSTFSKFMKDRGFDGIIYIEGGEGPNRKAHNSFVFYNSEKVGTYEYWQEKIG